MATIEIETTEKTKHHQSDQPNGSDMDSLLEEALYHTVVGCATCCTRGFGTAWAKTEFAHPLPRRACRTVAGTAGTSLLTKRETQILQSILAGQTNKQIARTLCRSRRTIEYHRHRLMLKLNAHSPADLVRCALASGLQWNHSPREIDES